MIRIKQNLGCRICEKTISSKSELQPHFIDPRHERYEQYYKEVAIPWVSLLTHEKKLHRHDLKSVLDISRREFKEKMSDFGLPSSFGVQEHQESREDQEGKFRPVIIDGCNVGHTYGQNKYNRRNYSAMGLWIAYQYFKDLGYENEDIIIVQRHISPRNLRNEDREIMKELKDLGILKDDYGFGYIGKDLVRPDDDLFILKLASKLEGIGKQNQLILIFVSLTLLFSSHKITTVVY